jgi:hypothetical protein
VLFRSPDEEIEKFFGAVEDPEDQCGPNKIVIQNNGVGN